MQRHFFFFLTMSLLIDFSLTLKASTLIFISGCGLAISSAKDIRFYSQSGKELISFLTLSDVVILLAFKSLNHCCLY